MTLVLDKRSALAGKPGLHALIIGVSAYANLPKSEDDPATPDSMALRQLSCAALSAYRVYCWLEEHQANFPVPVATCRLLLSPSAEELAAEPGLGLSTQGATLDNVLRAAKDWRLDAATRPENMTVFFFSGHGAQRTQDDAVLLLEDFGDGLGGPLKNAVDVGNIFKGMATSSAFPEIAQTQLYFIDACRDFLKAFKNHEPDDTTAVFRVQLSTGDTRCAPIFFAAVPGTKAYSIIGEQSLFSKALVDCLTNDAGDFHEVEGEDKWWVSVHTLGEALTMRLGDLNDRFNADQQVVTGGLVKDAIIHYLDQPPSVRVVLEVDPQDALGLTRLEVLDDAGDPLPALPVPLNPHPYETTWPAGFYTINAQINPPDPRFIDRPGRVRPVLPPRFQRRVKVAP
jgi:hypothetical protein